MSKSEKGAAPAEGEELSPGLKYVMAQVESPEFNTVVEGKAPILRPEDRKALRRVVIFLNRPLPVSAPGGNDCAKEMHLAVAKFAEASSVYARLRSMFDAMGESKKTIKADVDISVRKELQDQQVAGGEKITEKKIESLVDAHPRVKAFLIELGMYQTISEVAYSLRDSVRMRFTALEHRSNDVRAQFKAGG